VLRMLSAVKSNVLMLMCLLAAAAGGCEPSAPPPLSPTQEQDPARYEQSRLAEDEARRKNAEAEKILMKKRRSALPTK
jgi:hypothetical protein